MVTFKPENYTWTQCFQEPSQVFSLLIPWSSGLGHVSVQLHSGLGEKASRGERILYWHDFNRPFISPWGMKGYCLPPQAEQCPEFMNFFTVWCESGAWARHYHQEKVDNFPLPPHSFSYCWLYCSDMNYDLTPSAAKGVTKYWLQCSHKKCLSKRKRKTERKQESRKKRKL